MPPNDVYRTEANANAIPTIFVLGSSTADSFQKQCRRRRRRMGLCMRG